MKLSRITAAVLAEISPEVALGDVNRDSEINAADAAEVLLASANVGSGNDSGLTDW